MTLRRESTVHVRGDADRVTGIGGDVWAAPVGILCGEFGDEEGDTQVHRLIDEPHFGGRRFGVRAIPVSLRHRPVVRRHVGPWAGKGVCPLGAHHDIPAVRPAAGVDSSKPLATVAPPGRESKTSSTATSSTGAMITATVRSSQVAHVKHEAWVAGLVTVSRPALKTVDLEAVSDVYALRPLDQELVSSLNDEVTLADLAQDISEIGYPRAH
ncbi:hypothetical protein [Streptomyces sp. NPDC007355]|uniref:hypothetical protein n=1 Tax=Streptomyces sp. NPDC007355 TaxID=3364778 RepID=UPI0036C3B29D